MRPKRHDFTSGNIVKQLFVFSGPIIFANLLQVSYQFIDSLWVGNLIGANALGSVVVSGTVIFTMLSFIIGMNNAALTVLSQQKGKGDEEGLKRYVNAFVVVLTLLSLVLGGTAFVLAEPILSLLGTPDVLMAEARIYLQINALGVTFLTGYNFIGAMLRAIGDSRTPLTFVAIAVLLNTVLDPIFISVLGLGVQGAAVSTILSQGLSFLFGVVYVLRRNLVPFTVPYIPDKEEVLVIFKLGIPSGLQMSVISAGSAAIMSVVTSFGEDVVAGFSAAQRLDSLLMLPAHALGIAVTSMAGQNIGRGKWERVGQIAKYGLLYNLSVMFLIAILLVLFGEYGVRLFIQDETAVEFGSAYLKTIGLFYPFLGINFILNGIVRASGAMYQVLVLNIISFWVLRYPLSDLVSSWMGDIGMAYGIGISFIISSFIAIGYYKFGKWREIRLFEEKREA